MCAWFFSAYLRPKSSNPAARWGPPSAPALSEDLQAPHPQPCLAAAPSPSTWPTPAGGPAGDPEEAPLGEAGASAQAGSTRRLRGQGTLARTRATAGVSPSANETAPCDRRLEAQVDCTLKAWRTSRAGAPPSAPAANSMSLSTSLQMENLSTAPFHGVFFLLSPHLSAPQAEDVKTWIDLGSGEVVASRLECELARARLLTVFPPATSDGALQGEFARARESGHVTPFWVKQCVADSRLHDAAACALYRPLPRACPMRCMQDTAVCVSMYADEVRSEVEQLCNLIGARFSDVLKKVKTTHLVCKEAQGPKYESAKKWGTVVVTKQWLEACAVSGRKVSDDGFHPLPGPDQEQLNGTPKAHGVHTTAPAVDASLGLLSSQVQPTQTRLLSRPHPPSSAAHPDAYSRPEDKQTTRGGTPPTSSQPKELKELKEIKEPEGSGGRGGGGALAGLLRGGAAHGGSAVGNYDSNMPGRREGASRWAACDTAPVKADGAGALRRQQAEVAASEAHQVETGETEGDGTGNELMDLLDQFTKQVATVQPTSPVAAAGGANGGAPGGGAGENSPRLSGVRGFVRGGGVGGTNSLPVVGIRTARVGYTILGFAKNRGGPGEFWRSKAYMKVSLLF